MIGKWMIFYELFLHNYYIQRRKDACLKGLKHKISAINAPTQCECKINALK